MDSSHQPDEKLIRLEVEHLVPAIRQFLSVFRKKQGPRPGKHTENYPIGSMVLVYILTLGVY